MASLMKWAPWFVTRVKGHPNLVSMHSYRNFVVIVVALIFNVLTSTYLVAWFVATRIYLFLIYLLAGLIVYTNSSPHFINRSSRRLVTNFARLWVANCEAFLHIFNMKICTHKTRLEVELLCSCGLTSKVVQCNAMEFTKNLMRYVHLEDTITLWENRNSPWWNVKGHYVDVHSMSRLMVEALLFHSS